MSASCSANQSKNPLLAAERMPLALKLMMRMQDRKSGRRGKGTSPRRPAPSRVAGRLPSALRTRRVGGARRQDRVHHLRLAPGERAQEVGDLAGFLLVDVPAQLGGAHD